jgi:predicted TIM-barrel fold metal-dependent hydrolase
MDIIDGHSHLFQVVQPATSLKKSVKQVKDFDIKRTLEQLDRIGIGKVQTMPQEMTRVMGQWLGSNELSADIQSTAPDRIVAFAAAEPVGPEGAFNKARFDQIRKMITEDGLKGILLTPPYGHYYANDRQVYPFYELAVELDIPIYFHHSHMYGPSKFCPLKYCQGYMLDDVTIDFPELRFNVEHMGYPWTEEILAIMARCPNVYADIALYVNNIPPFMGRPLMLARNLGMARDYNVLDRIFWGSDYDYDENVDRYVSNVTYQINWIKERLNKDMEKQGYPPLTPEEMDGLLRRNVLKLWKQA